MTYQIEIKEKHASAPEEIISYFVVDTFEDAIRKINTHIHEKFGAKLSVHNINKLKVIGMYDITIGENTYIAVNMKKPLSKTNTSDKKEVKLSWYKADSNEIRHSALFESKSDAITFIMDLSDKIRSDYVFLFESNQKIGPIKIHDVNSGR